MWLFLTVFHGAGEAVCSTLRSSATSARDGNSFVLIAPPAGTRVRGASACASAPRTAGSRRIRRRCLNCRESHQRELRDVLLVLGQMASPVRPPSPSQRRERRRP